ncbi:hypothetical protein [Paenibacillus sp. YYML68]|uniref:hypothetical protein n=1 Tax=Paenibacillus sp. YYML68 TaxID=2909250 RepID=UPI00249076B3|nr:hypothetical protein [Paenibacillus sp. YYML68]
MNRIYEAQYKGWKAVCLESPSMKAILIPELGSKMVSLVDKRAGREWLVQATEGALRRYEYGSDFLASDVSGWDEMCPTVESCEYSGISLPDHGEVWSIPWETRATSESVTMTVRGRAMSYELRKTISFVQDDTLRFDYELVNLGDAPIPFLWMPHPLLQMNEHTVISLPPSMTELVCVFGGRQLEIGSVYKWPEADHASGERLALDQVGPLTNNDCRKLYYPVEVPDGWSGLYDRQCEALLTLQVSREQVPYFGLWIDEGACLPHFSNCALEPCTGYYDALSRAVDNGQVSWAEAGQSYRWTMSVHVRQGRDASLEQLLTAGE